MNYVENEKQKQALTNWLAQAGWTVFGTLKYTNGYDIAERKAEADVCRFWNELDRAYLGRNLVDKGHRIERVVVKQLGESGSNLHYHFLANPSADIPQFCENARWAWNDASSFTIGYAQTDIRRIISKQRAVSYILHEHWRLGADTFYLPAIHRASSLPTPQPIHKMRRLQKKEIVNKRRLELLNEPIWLHRHLDELANACDEEIAERTATH